MWGTFMYGFLYEHFKTLNKIMRTKVYLEGTGNENTSSRNLYAVPKAALKGQITVQKYLLGT